MSDRIVPELAMNASNIANLPELSAHLEELENNAATPFNAKLFDDVELQLTGLFRQLKGLWTSG
jgi:hypothetical protein